MSVQDLPTRTRRRVKRSSKGTKTRYRTSKQQSPTALNLPAKTGKLTGKPAVVEPTKPVGPVAAVEASNLEATGVRWSKGERLEDLFEGLCDTLALTGEDTSPAVIDAGTAYSFRD
ncbi:MAG: hypothetical protein ABJQ43_02265, partial [Anderseniella sp.]